MEKKGKTNDITLVLCVLACFFGGMMLWLQMNSTSATGAGFQEDTVFPLDTKFVVEGNGTTVTTALPTEYEGKAGEKIILTTTLEKQEESNSLLFYVQQSDVQVYLNDRLLVASLDRSISKRIPPVSRWYFARLPQDYEGQEIRIEITPALNDYMTELPEIYLGTKTAFLYMILRNAKMELAVGIPMIILAALLFMVSLFMGSPVFRQRLSRLALLAMLISIWMLSECQITQVFSDNIYWSLALLFSCFYLIPTVALSFLLTYPSIVRHKFMRWTFWAFVAVYILVQLLQITGTFIYVKMVGVVHVQIIILILEMLVCFYIVMKEKNAEMKEDLSIYKGLFLLGIFALIDMGIYYVNPAGDAGRFTMLGIAVFLIYLAYGAIRFASEMQRRRVEEAIYKELAMKDLMTGLESRTAFEQIQSAFSSAQTEEKVIMLMADVNNLKKINDRFGHRAGDDAIVSTAYVMKECFSHKCRCFRFGGDEFCVVAQGVALDEFREMMQLFEQRIGSLNEQKEYPLQVAFGCYESTNYTLEKCMREADHCMYLHKAKLKENMDKTEQVFCGETI